MGRPSDLRAKIELRRAAEQVFGECGLERARIEEITARAGRSKGSFYLHFRSKEDAFRHIVEAFVARLASMLGDSDDCCAAAAETSFEALLAHWLEHDLEMFEFIWQNRGIAGLLLAGGGSAQFGYLVDEFMERVVPKVRRLLDRGVTRGAYVADLDLDVATGLIAGLYDRLARHLVRQRSKPDLRAWLTNARNLLLRGLGTPELRRVLDRAVTEPAVTSRQQPARRAGDGHSSRRGTGGQTRR